MMLAFARVARTRTTPQQTTSFQHAVANTVVSTAAAIDVQWGAVTIHDSAAILDAILKAAETEAFYCGKSLFLSRNLCWPDQAYEDIESYMADAGSP